MTNDMQQKSLIRNLEKEWFQAAKNGDIEKIKALLAKGMPIDHTNQTNKQTAALIATYHQQENAVIYLVEQGANVNHADNIKNTVFLLAAATGLLAVVKKTYQLADLSLVNRYGGNGLIPAAEKGHIATVRFLLTKKLYDVNFFNKLGWTALHEVAILSPYDNQLYADIAELLLQHGADPKLKTKDMQRLDAYQHALKRQHYQLAQVIAKYY